MLASCFPHVGLFTLLSYFYTQNSDTSYLRGDKNRRGSSLLGDLSQEWKEGDDFQSDTVQGIRGI